MTPFLSWKAGQDPVAASFVAKQLGVPPDLWGNHNTLSFFDKRGLKAALVYNHYNWPNIAMHIAVRPGALWANPATLFHIFAYPFLQLKCKRVTAPVHRSNFRSAYLCNHLGYKLEGILREADPRGGDILLFGMLWEECRWLNYRERNEDPRKILAPEAPGLQ